MNKDKARKRAEYLRSVLYKNIDHPYVTYENKIIEKAQSKFNLLDAGCGHDGPLLKKLNPYCKLAVGTDVIEIEESQIPQTAYIVINNIQELCFSDESFHMVICRSVIEHLNDPCAFFQEVYRILKTGGFFISLTPNLYDYSSLISKIIPNRYHRSIVKAVEGRDEEDTFPTYYKCNTEKGFKQISSKVGFEVLEISMLGQYPCYFMFSPSLFLIGTAYDRLVTRFKVFKNLRGWILAVLQK